MYKIYKISNCVNNKIYIGLTSKTLEERFNKHIETSNNGRGYYLHKAIRKYGLSKFKIETLEDNIETIEMACEREKHFIQHYDSFNNGYNLTIGGEGREGYKPSKETIKKTIQSLNVVCENGKTIAQNAYIKRNNTLLKNDKDALKKIGKKSSETQKKNGKTKGKNNKNYRWNKILIFDDKCNLKHEFYYNNLNELDYSNLPNKRMIQLCLRTHKPMYLLNNRGEHAKKFRGWFACYENEMYCDVNVKFRKFN